MDELAVCNEIGRANMLRTLFLFEKYKTINDDVGGKRRYSQNILQLSKNDFKSMKTTNGDYCMERPRHYMAFATNTGSPVKGSCCITE